QTRDFTAVTDWVEATRAAAAAPAAAGGVYNIGGGSPASVNDALCLLARFAGRALDVQYHATEHGDVRHTGADTTLARAELGYAPRHWFAAGLQAEFEWMRGIEAGEPQRRDTAVLG